MARLTHAKRVFVGGVLMSALLVYTAMAGNTSTASYESPNSVERRMFINSLDNEVTQRGAATPQWTSDILVKALGDESPVVVAAAVYQIGNFGLEKFSSRLISLYTEVEKKYSSSYARRIQYSIVPALGKTGTKEVTVFLAKLLEQDEGTSMGEFLLVAIKDLNDPTLVDCVKQYQIKMEELVKFAREKNYDPLIYSRKLAYIHLAVELEKFLSKGGK